LAQLNKGPTNNASNKTTSNIQEHVKEYKMSMPTQNLKRVIKKKKVQQNITLS
jgi:hypothetical protein